MCCNMHCQILAQRGITTGNIDQYANAHAVTVAGNGILTLHPDKTPHGNILANGGNHCLACIFYCAGITIRKRHGHECIDIGRIIRQHTFCNS